jgi:hypothetical protein
MKEAEIKMSADTPMDRDLTPALAEFAKLLKRRLERSIPTNEDTVRYTFYYALIEGLKLKPEDIMVEPPHEKIARARLDLKTFELEYSFEFKYENIQLTTKDESTSGQLPMRMFSDVFRLATLHAAGKEPVFIYLTARWGKNYLRNTKWKLVEAFNLPVGNSLLIDESYLKERPHILTRNIGNIVPCRINSIYSCCLPNEHALRVYRVGGSGAGAAKS